MKNAKHARYHDETGKTMHQTRAKYDRVVPKTWATFRQHHIVTRQFHDSTGTSHGLRLQIEHRMLDDTSSCDNWWNHGYIYMNESFQLWIQNSNFTDSLFQFWIQNPNVTTSPFQFWIQNSNVIDLIFQLWIQNSNFKLHNFQFWIQNSNFKIFKYQFWIQNSNFNSYHYIFEFYFRSHCVSMVGITCW